jgi:hypothetical protein
LINKTVNLGAFSVINSPFSRKRWGFKRQTCL